MEDTLIVTADGGGQYTVSSESGRFAPQTFTNDSVDRLRLQLQPHGIFGKQFKDVIRQLNEKGTARVPIAEFFVE
jgi:hypothetical protein